MTRKQAAVKAGVYEAAKTKHALQLQVAVVDLDLRVRKVTISDMRRHLHLRLLPTDSLITSLVDHKTLLPLLSNLDRDTQLSMHSKEVTTGETNSPMV